MTSGFFTGDLLRGLAIRVLLFLTLALLPIGLIAIVQTREISKQAQASAELSLIAVTERASAAEERVIQEAFGAAEALASIVRLRRHNDAECSAFLKEYQQASNIYSLVAFIATAGEMSCSSTEETMDFSDNAGFRAAIDGERRRASTINGRISRRPVTLINSPVYEDDTLIGVMAISIPYSAIASVEEPDLPVRPLALLTYNQDGKILTSEREFDSISAEIPRDVSFSALSGEKSSVFQTVNQIGKERIYAVVPLVPETVFAVSIWPTDTPSMQTDLTTRMNTLLPIFMWLASLIVAFWALDRLAITHIQKLGRQMRRFALNRTLPRVTMGPSVPTELVAMEQAFLEMAESIMRDEATLEDSLRQKNILLKEVHHRVKNNLQLISSIMNMQIRQSKSDDARTVLRRLQERILGLATVHENLYKDDDLVRVDASALLQQSVNRMLTVGLAPGSHVEVEQNYENIQVDPDDAAPLTLLASEAVTNALKYVGSAEGEKAVIKVDLRYHGAETARLTVENSVTGKERQRGTGLGTKLITAFARQLNGQVEVEHTDAIFRLSITFPVPTSSKPVYDY